jgi:hypothetical protein
MEDNLGAFLENFYKMEDNLGAFLEDLEELESTTIP